MVYEFKVGDELRGKRFREYRGVVMRVDGEDVTFRNRLGDLIVSTQSRLLRDFVVLPVECFHPAPHAPPESFRQVFCAWTGQTAKPEPARTALQQAREATLHAVRRLMYAHATIDQIDRHIEHVIREAKAEALAECEAPGPCGRVVGTALAQFRDAQFVGDGKVEIVFSVRVPRHAAIACADSSATSYRVSATSKGAV